MQSLFFLSFFFKKMTENLITYHSSFLLLHSPFIFLHILKMCKKNRANWLYCVLLFFLTKSFRIAPRKRGAFMHTIVIFFPLIILSYENQENGVKKVQAIMLGHFLIFFIFREKFSELTCIVIAFERLNGFMHVLRVEKC